MSKEIEYWVRAIEDEYVIRERDTSDEWDAGDYGLNLTVTAIHASEVTGWDVTHHAANGYDDVYGFDKIERGQMAHLVVVRYKTGSTFGSNGAWCIAAIKSDIDEAMKIADRCEGDNDLDRMYRPWDGYFEYLESATVESFIVRD